MAERRMFSKSLMFSNGFMQLSKAAANLYMYLCLSADDDGFADNTDTVCRMCRCTRKHLQELTDGGWLMTFDTPVIAITHWHKHNQIKKDRYKPTDYQQELATLEKNSAGAYIPVDPQRIHFGSNLDPQERIGKESKEKNSIDQDSIEEAIESLPAEPVSSSAPPPAAEYDDIDYDKILRWYQLLCKDLKPCEELTPNLRRKIAACLQGDYSELSIPGVFYNAMQSDFLSGRNNRGWQADLEWLLDHFEEVHSGKYATWR